MKHNWLFWIPRALILLFALFTMLFSFDVFNGYDPWYRIAQDFLIHNIPFFALMLILVISWKYPAVSSVICYLAMLFFAKIVRSNGSIYSLLSFTVPLFIVATMFLLEYLRRPQALPDADQTTDKA
ncbi:MAG: hypothetical protein CVU48_10580 [Candidatus Cloacimonetes bacterium HGW-Cloacimonetes-1]|jgi:hypothetical protein|nr:MAG: hypothetical protein CVU48_10580 [Candidatus Cloacimonetes bacterium HGW-Cloacimonetes-1]